MSLLIAGASAATATVHGFETTVDGESTEGGFGDLLAQLFAAPGATQQAAAGMMPGSVELPTESGGEEDLVEEGLALLESMLTSPIAITVPVEGPPAEAQTANTATTATAAPAAPGTVAQPPVAEPAAPTTQGQFGTGTPVEDAPTAGIVEVEAPVASTESPQEQALEPGMESPIDAVALPEEREAKPAEFTAASSEADAETQQSVVRPVGNAQASNGNSEGNPEQSRPQFANNVVAAAHNASQTGGAAVAEVANAAGAEPAPQVMAPEQVVEAVIERAEDGGGEVSIRLDPPELGEVLIRVTTDGDSVRVHIQAERPEAAQLLRNAASVLESLLSERGLDLSDVFVGADQRGSEQQSGDQPQARDDESETPFSALLSAPPGAEVRQHNRIRSAYNPDGALLYRV